MLALRAALEKQPITLIQGPPGTGKTRIVLSLLSVILHARPSHGARRGGVHATRDDADAGARRRTRRRATRRPRYRR